MKEIIKIHERHQEPLFRMALYHMIGKGSENFTKEMIEDAKTAVREGDEALKVQGKHSFMTVGFQHAIIDCAAELSKISITDILKFVKHYLYFEGDEKLSRVCKECGESLVDDADATPINEQFEDNYYECKICHEYSMENGSVILCESCGSYYTPNHSVYGENPCPYCSD